MDLAEVKDGLVSEVRLSPLQAGVFLFITTGGRKTAEQVAKGLGITESDALAVLRSLADAGSLIDMPGDEFEAMHPRFTVVNMYRRMCERENVEFGRNKAVDGIGAALEMHYDSARTK